jgi:hypothetical protein
MSALFKKLKLGNQTTIHVLNAPASFEAQLDAASAKLAAASRSMRTGPRCGFGASSTSNR